MISAKSFNITKEEVLEAYRHVKAKHGSAGSDGETIKDFEQERRNNLYKIWNRMSSGSYIPSAIRKKLIDKKDGGQRQLGIPTVSDRIAQAVVKARLEPLMDPKFHADSYGYRPGKSALDAVGVARRRSWEYDWVIDLDIKGFFDSIDHDLLMRAVRKFTIEKWIILYIERWLKAPIQEEDGTLTARERGTPQGGVISPLLANLFLHYVFDEWMRQKYPQIQFERYADDVIVHCRTEAEAQELRSVIEKRLRECGLELHPKKTKIVYCKDSRRRKRYPTTQFDFLGYTFRPRKASSKCGGFFTSFQPAISKSAEREIRDSIRSWKLHRRSGTDMWRLAEEINPIVRGWIQYYGRYYRSALASWIRQLEGSLAHWAMRKYKRLRCRRGKTWKWIHRMKRNYPLLFVHWQFGNGEYSSVGAV